MIDPKITAATITAAAGIIGIYYRHCLSTGKEFRLPWRRASVPKVRFPWTQESIPEFSHVCLIVKLLRWRARDSGKKPFESNKTIRFLGHEVTIDIWDEATLSTEWTPVRASQRPFVINHVTSGLVTLEPVTPDNIQPDPRNYERTDGRAIRSVLARIPHAPIAYSTTRFNAFQAGHQDFSFAVGENRIRNVDICVNFTPVLAEAAYKSFPRAYIAKSWNHPLGERRVQLTTQDGKVWHFRKELSPSDEKVNFFWELVDRPTSGDVYVFGYGSLMWLPDVKRTLPDLEEQEPISALIDGYRKSWTAYSHNSEEILADDGSVPTSLVYLNLEPHEFGKAHGVLIKVRADDLPLLDKRESCYVCVDVTEHIKLFGPQELDEKTRVFTYVSLVPPPESEEKSTAIRQDYINIVKKASKQLDKLTSGVSSYAVEIDESQERSNTRLRVEHYPDSSSSRYVDEE